MIAMQHMLQIANTEEKERRETEQTFIAIAIAIAIALPICLRPLFALLLLRLRASSALAPDDAVEPPSYGF
jgi:hypothetical protein